MLTCAALPPYLPSFPHPRHLLQTNRITTHEINKLKKSIHARKTHSHTKSTLLFFHFYLQLYASVGLIHEAQRLFDEMPERTLISWTILMSEYTRHGFVDETLRVFQNMVECNSNDSLQPDSFVYAIVLRACSLTKDLSYGCQLHCRVVKIDGVVDSYVENALVSMYSCCGSIWDSARVFKGIVRPDLVSWSSLLRGYVQNGLEEEGIILFVEMIQSGITPDVTVFSIVIGASANVGWLQSGAQMHCYVIKANLNSSLFLDNTLMNFYVKCGDLDSSMQIFRLMPKRDMVSWNTIIKGYVDNHHNYDALRVFRAMMNGGFDCDNFTLTSILQAVTCVGALDLGREIHGYIIRAGLESDLYVTSSLLDMYIECIDHKSLCTMREVPIKIFLNHLKGRQSDEFIIASVLKLCSLRLDLETGRALHSLIIKHDLLSDSYVISSLIDMYSKCEMPVAAQRLFERVEDKGMVPWAAIIAGCCWNGWFQKALQLFRRMHGDCVAVNEYIYTSVVMACLGLGDLKKAKELHCNIIRSGYGSNISILNTLVKIYSNLWHPERALGLCSLMPESEIIWSSLIEACVRNRYHETNLKLLEKIQRCYGKLDCTSAYHILSSCEKPFYLNAGTQVHAYLTKRGLISDTISNNSLIKMYSACGMVTDAVTAFQSMPERNSESWTAVISANVDNGNPLKAIQLFAEWNNKSPDSSTLISVLKAYAQMGLVDEAYRFFNSMDEHYGIEPSIEHYSCMIEVLGRSGKLLNAHDFIDSSIPFKPVPLVWETLLSASRIHGNMKVAKYAAEKLLELEPRNLTANLLLEQVLLTAGMWDDASVLTIKNKSMKLNSSWIEIRNLIFEFTSDQIPTEDVSVKLVELELMMEERGYVADRNHLLHNAEEEDYEGVGLHHTEMKALAFGLLSLPNGTPIRIIKSVRICGDCHSALKFMSTFLLRELLVKDSCTFHHFRNGKCSCKDKW